MRFEILKYCRTLPCDLMCRPQRAHQAAHPSTGLRGMSLPYLGNIQPPGGFLKMFRINDGKCMYVEVGGHGHIMLSVADRMHALSQTGATTRASCPQCHRGMPPHGSCLLLSVGSTLCSRRRSFHLGERSCNRDFNVMRVLALLAVG